MTGILLLHYLSKCYDINSISKVTNLILDERMEYVTMDKLDPERLPDVVEGLTREDVMMECHQEGRINRQEKDKLQEHMADVTVGMLYLACKGTCH